MVARLEEEPPRAGGAEHILDDGVYDLLARILQIHGISYSAHGLNLRVWPPLRVDNISHFLIIFVKMLPMVCSLMRTDPRFLLQIGLEHLCHLTTGQLKYQDESRT